MTSTISSSSNNEDNNNITAILLFICGICLTIQILRVAIDLISQATIIENKKEKELLKKKASTNTSGKNGTTKVITDGKSTTMTTTTTETTQQQQQPLLNKNKNKNQLQPYGTVSIVSDNQEDLMDDDDDDDDEKNKSSYHYKYGYLEESLPTVSKFTHIAIMIYLIYAIIMTATSNNDDSNDNDNGVINNDDDGSANGIIWLYVMIMLTICFGYTLQHLRKDFYNKRFGIVQRSLYVFITFILLILSFIFSIVQTRQRKRHNSGSESSTSTSSHHHIPSLLGICIVYFLLSLLEFVIIEYPDTNTDQTSSASKKKRSLSSKALLSMLKPYVWPDATPNTDNEENDGSYRSSSYKSAILNRTLAMLTWICVILSKLCNIISPILIGKASTCLASQDYKGTITYSIYYSFIVFLSSTFKEGQSLLYLKVAQEAFIQLSELTFHHIHSLSLDWHLRKKLGETIRSMDRGIAACDTLMKYLFLWLVPAIIECLVVCIIFATYFNYMPLAITVFYFVFLYVIWTILVTLWRKKYRKAVVKSDNEWHDICTDSLVNFETVKYFTAESYEMKRFGNAVKHYQIGSVNVQSSLSFLNITQKVILQTCLAMSLSLSAYGIKKRNDCCIVEYGCDSGTSECCNTLSDQGTCVGMEVGDFVAVLTFIIQLFTPLNYLGSVYNAIVMAIIDLQSLSELLAENPDVIDYKDAITLTSSSKPKDTYSSSTSITTNDDDNNNDDIAVEFDNVYFHYPTQPSNKGLKGLSFSMKRGTTTAVVGPTGAGKTTISRLLFRFYDVLDGAVKVNGYDVRTLTQKSLRGYIGVVPQSASMFNDTIRSNIMYGRRDASEDELIKCCEDAQLLTFINSLDDKFDTIVGDRGLKLSGGEKQRTAIARCLLKDPPIVVLDEATSALDTITENSVQEALDSLGSERTVLVIAHRLGTIRNADNIVVLKDGIVAEQGTHDDLLELNGIYADMWNMQLHSTSSSRTNSRSNLLELEE